MQPTRRLLTLEQRSSLSKKWAHAAQLRRYRPKIACYTANRWAEPPIIAAYIMITDYYA